ncbi:hypothetical protein TSUD_158960 [Trifolium subterraneum]|uniref:Uncharacterized protein n=1 Tax=Trifolium subterraneum TaxID=3900 RepID=A0A2Z6NU85_TRISU|nr:hypothetical protein TSUD_158960 [Trifolium subterraneum]
MKDEDDVEPQECEEEQLELNQQQSSMASSVQFTVQPLRDISTPPCVFPTESTASSQKQSPLLICTASISPPALDTPPKRKLDSESSQWLSTFPTPGPPKTNHRDSPMCESPLQLQTRLGPTCRMKLPWFWVKELRIADPILDWEKLKRAMFEGLLFNTPPNNNFNATETPTPPKIIPPPEPPDW